jgi:3-(3-hydroxy-phenyl)propionate hydroxylase
VARLHLSRFHAATLELLEEINVTGRMHDEGLVVPRYQFRDRAEALVAEFGLTLLADETRYPHRLQLNRQHLVRFRYDRLLEDDRADLRFGCRFSAAEQTADGVTVTIETATGPQVLRASHLIGAAVASRWSTSAPTPSATPSGSRLGEILLPVFSATMGMPFEG